MTGQLTSRYQRFRALGMRPADALTSARESLEALPGTLRFAAALVELETRLAARLNGIPLEPGDPEGG